jgi:catecholate siderophore receptor
MSCRRSNLRPRARRRCRVDSVAALTNNVLVPIHFTVGDTLVNGKLSALDKATANSSIYAMAHQLEAAAGFELPVSGNLNNAQNPIYDPQETKTTEIGGKLDLFKGSWP